MGGTTFETIGRGKTAKEAFDARKAEARYDHGHAGYTGTIAEKHEFTLIAPPPGTVDRSELIAFARKLVDDGDARVDDWASC